MMADAQLAETVLFATWGAGATAIGLSAILLAWAGASAIRRRRTKKHEDTAMQQRFRRDTYLDPGSWGNMALILACAGFAVAVLEVM